MAKNLGSVLITGAAKRIGREIAINLAAKGYDVVISYNKSKVEAEKLSAEISQKFKVKTAIFSCDLTKIGESKKLAEFMRKNFKNWNLLINNASIFHKSKFISGDEKEMMDNLNIHLISPLILSQEFAKVAPKNSQIINMIDKNIARYDTSYFYYLLSKKFLADLTKMLSLELSPKIRVNGIAPGFILNSIDGEDLEMSQKIIKKIPLETKGEVENICQTVEFLLENKFINGQIIFVDGGASLNHAG